MLMANLAINFSNNQEKHKSLKRKETLFQACYKHIVFPQIFGYIIYTSIAYYTTKV